MKDAKKHGKGKTLYSNTEMHEGLYEVDMKVGLGKFTYASGNVYEGNYTNDLSNGQGVYRYTDKTKFEGEFLDGRFKTGVYINQKGTLLECDFTKGPIKKGD